MFNKRINMTFIAFSGMHNLRVYGSVDTFHKKCSFFVCVSNHKQMIKFAFTTTTKKKKKKTEHKTRVVYEK